MHNLREGLLEKSKLALYACEKIQGIGPHGIFYNTAWRFLGCGLVIISKEVSMVQRNLTGTGKLFFHILCGVQHFGVYSCACLKPLNSLLLYLFI
jgi:hypothetical protein